MQILCGNFYALVKIYNYTSLKTITFKVTRDYGY